MVKRTQLDGEYMVVGRQTIETNTLVVPFGSDPSTSVAIQGTGLQENEFQDGFRMSTRATQPLTMNVDVKDGVDQGMLTALQGQQPVNDYRYSVVTNLAAVTPDLNQQVTVVQMPINAVRIQKMMQAMGVPPTGQVAIAVAQRGVLQNPGGATGNLGGAATQRRGLTRSGFRKEVARQVQAGTPPVQSGAPPVQSGTATTNNNPVASQVLLAPTFTPIQADAVLDQTNMRIAVPVRQVDGEYILTMQVMGGTQAAQPAPEGQSPTESQTSTVGSPASSSSAASTKPTEGTSNRTEPAKPERRQESSEKDKYGQTKPAQGAVIMTMKMIDDMAQTVLWGGQAPITQMMNDYVKAQTGKGIDTSRNGTSSDTAKIIV
ncbi:hypothetical protein N0V83_008446 [Neocucurbitaria cava]|uniref:Uncharacterized protein n=1 Tax=Neocucurbitaria cava TaxID=798079 RepID=A0A9W9CIS5_9PLEO|nr:hypothetical protein N0V83_008446 [Neocucurbitaria cava]